MYDIGGLFGPSGDSSSFCLLPSTRKLRSLLSDTSKHGCRHAMNMGTGHDRLLSLPPSPGFSSSSFRLLFPISLASPRLISLHLTSPHRRPVAAAFRRLFPSRAVLGVFLPTPSPPKLALFMRRAPGKALRSAELAASPDFACRFLPPKPYFSFFFWRFAFGWCCSRPGLEEEDRDCGLDCFCCLCELSSWSTPTSNRSASVVPTSPEDSCRSVFGEGGCLLVMGFQLFKGIKPGRQAGLGVEIGYRC